MWILTPRIFRLCLKHHETPVLTHFRMHIIMQTLATGSQGFDPERWILLRPHPITSACPPLQTPNPASVLAISNPLHHNFAHSTLHSDSVPSSFGPPGLSFWRLPSLPLCSVSHWGSAHDPQGLLLLLFLCLMKIAQAHVVKLLKI